MTKTAIIVIAICILFIGGVVAFALTAGVSGWSWFSLGERVDIDESASLNVEGVTEVSISLPCGNVIVTSGEEPGAELKGYLNTSNRRDKYLFVEKQDGKLSVRFDPGNMPLFSRVDVTLTVVLPEEVFADVKVANSSGGIDVIDIKAKNLNVSNSSGNVEISGCSGDELDARLSSGNIKVASSAFEGMFVGCQSGNVRTEGTSGSLTVQNSSGNIYVVNHSGAADASDSSGNIDMTLVEKELSAVNVSLSSGNATLHLSPEAKFTLDAHTSSGNVNCDFAVLVSGGVSRGTLKGECNGGGETVKVSVSSGNITLLKE